MGNAAGACAAFPANRGVGEMGKSWALPSGGGEANALHFQEYPHSPREGEKWCQSLCQTLWLWDSEGTTL